MVLFNPQLGSGEVIHTFPKVISPKVNIIMRLEFELAHNNAIVQHVRHYATRGVLVV